MPKENGPSMIKNNHKLTEQATSLDFWLKYEFFSRIEGKPSMILLIYRIITSKPQNDHEITISPIIQL